MVSVSPEAQYEYLTFVAVNVFSEVVYIPAGSVYGTIAPSPPCCSAVSAQLHWPSPPVHLATSQPAAMKMAPILSQLTGTEETERHAALSGNETLPVVVVLSRYVPSALATKVPVV
jgi:hypothetical protein